MILSLTSFRFIIAFVVFLFHCQFHFNWKLGITILDKFLLNGATFMSGFFILSGFIMSHAYSNTDFKERENIFNFYLKRFAKIYPTYIVAITFYSTVVADIPPQQYLRVMVNDLFLVQGFFPSMFALNLTAGTWSLTTEMFLYFLFPFLMILSGKSPKILMLAIVLTGIANLNVKTDLTDLYIYTNPVFRISEFLYGIGFYFWHQKIKDIKFGSHLHLLIVILLFWACKALGSDNYQYMWGQFIIVPLFGLWITMVFYSKSKIYNNKYLQYLGLISYSFYLWQSISIYFGKQLITIYPYLHLHLVVVVTFMINLCISAASYHLLEEKARKYILQKFVRKDSCEINNPDLILSFNSQLIRNEHPK